MTYYKHKMSQLICCQKIVLVKCNLSYIWNGPGELKNFTFLLPVKIKKGSYETNVLLDYNKNNLLH